MKIVFSMVSLMLTQAVLDGSLDGAFVAGPIDHPDLMTISVFKEELVLLSASRWKSLAALRDRTPASGPTILVFRTGCSYRQRLEQLMSEFGWPSAARLEFGTLDGIIGCVAADMGVTLLPRAVAERSELSGAVRLHALRSEHRRVDTLFIHRRTLHEGCALRSFLSCVKTGRLSLAA
jgi:DNA-binding transcriptional LysR family regulator